MAYKFRNLNINEWRQFRCVNIDFSDRVTILTGRNGTGKTTILNILAQHSNFPAEFLGSPIQSSDGPNQFNSGVWPGTPSIDQNTDLIGRIAYTENKISEIRIARKVGINFKPTISPKIAVSVLNIPSHRQLQTYKRVESIPTVPITRSTALSNYQTQFWNVAKGDVNVARTTPLTKMKEALISMAAFGPGNDRVIPNHESYSAFQDFEKRLKLIIPKNIGFRRLLIRIPDVIVETDSGQFLIDASSGGLMSLIDITWQITLFGREEQEFVVTIDEPENHLHPSMQREFLPALVRTFPEAQFIIATHSPFIVSSVRSAKVYAFDTEEQYRYADAIPADLSFSKKSVVTLPVDISDRISASDVLQRVLGVPISVPIWAEQELDIVLRKYEGRDLTAVDIQEIHSELSGRGLGEFLPEIVARAAGRNA